MQSYTDSPAPALVLSYSPPHMCPMLQPFSPSYNPPAKLEQITLNILGLQGLLIKHNVMMISALWVTALLTGLRFPPTS